MKLYSIGNCKRFSKTSYVNEYWSVGIMYDGGGEGIYLLASIYAITEDEARRRADVIVELFNKELS